MTRFFSTFSAFLIAFCAFGAAADPVDKQIGFQQAVTPAMHELTFFHNAILMPIITGIVIFVLLLLVFVLVRFNAKANPQPSKTTHNVPLEIIWTLVPVLILIVIAVPSFRLLFFAAVTPEAEMTIKATGNQWNWTYDYPDHGDINFTSVLAIKNKATISEKDSAEVKAKKEESNAAIEAAIQTGQIPLLSTDNAVVLPVDTVIRIQVTASDVLHSFAVPAFGIKTDAVPGRLNETWVKIEKPGTYYGQCSELCGKDHGFMPIEVRAVPKEEFAAWVIEKGGKMPVAEPAAATETAPAAVPADTEENIQSPKEEGQAPVREKLPVEDDNQINKLLPTQ